jgi:hypothetical protein
MASLIQPSRSFEYELDDDELEVESAVVLAELDEALEELSEEELVDAELLELEFEELDELDDEDEPLLSSADFESAGSSMVQPVTIRFGSVNVRPSGSDLFLLSENSSGYLSPSPSARSAMPERVSPETTV